MPQRPILTVTVNPALDLAGDTPVVSAGPKLRIARLTVEPGGGGVNVARAVVLLGGQSTAFVALGGAIGAQLAQQIAARGVAVHRFDIPGETRQSLAVTEGETRQQFRFVLPGPDWTAELGDACVQAIVMACPPEAVVVISGSQPPGLGDDFPARVAVALAGRGVDLIVDTSGAALDRLVRMPLPDAAPDVLRMDRAESEAIAGRALPSAADSLDLAASLVARGVARVVILARGAEGSVLAARDLRLHCAPPPVEVLSAVGAGDSFTGALALARARGQDWRDALALGTAAAAAAVTTPASALCPADLTQALLAGCRFQDPVSAARQD